MSASIPFRNGSGDPVKPVSFSATDAKNTFGRILEEVARNGIVTITRHDETKAVMLSLEEYQVLLKARPDVLDTLTDEFDAMLRKMQRPGAREAMQAAFDATPAELGRAAVKGARRRRA